MVTTEPLDGLSFITVLSPLLTTHTLEPSNSIPAAPSPTLKVPRLSPSARTKLGNGLAEIVADPNVRTFGCDPEWTFADCVRSQHERQLVLKPGHRVVVVVGHPDAVAGECQTQRAFSNGESAEIGALGD